MRDEEWDELQPKFRREVLEAQHKEGKTIPEIADEAHIGRATIYELIANAVMPRRATRFAAQMFVASRNRRRDTEHPEA